jgi:hypothetical protein
MVDEREIRASALGLPATKPFDNTDLPGRRRHGDDPVGMEDDCRLSGRDACCHHRPVRAADHERAFGRLLS